MAPSTLDSMEQGTCVPSRFLDQTPPPAAQSPSVIEDGFYQPIPSRRWYAKLLDYLSPMPQAQRSHHYPHHRFTPEKTRSPSNSVSRHEFVVTEVPLSGPEPLPSRRPQVIALIRQACFLVPIIIFCFFGILHIIQWSIGGIGLIAQSDDPSFLPDWGQPGHGGEGLAHYPTDATRDVIPIPVHSHNDYWRRIPLWEALHFGCTGVEADVWLFDDDLFVGHSTSALTRNRTFKSLYVDPLIELLDKQNPQTEFANTSHHGVFDEDPDQTLVLLVDLKTDGRTTFPVVEAQLEGLRSKGYLTYFNGTHTIPGAITVVGTGNTPFDMLIANTTYRDIFFDAPLDRMWEPPQILSASDGLVDGLAAPDIGLNGPPPDFQVDIRSSSGQGKSGIPASTPSSVFNSSTSYYASMNFKKAVGFVWRGRLSHKQQEIIRGQIRGAKKRGLKARYWNTPAWPISLRNHIWHILVQEGADMLNADDLRGAAVEDWRRWRHQWW